jgi:hypothetical protein
MSVISAKRSARNSGHRSNLPLAQGIPPCSASVFTHNPTIYTNLHPLHHRSFDAYPCLFNRDASRTREQQSEGRDRLHAVNRRTDRQDQGSCSCACSIAKSLASFMWPNCGMSPSTNELAEPLTTSHIVGSARRRISIFPLGTKLSTSRFVNLCRVFVSSSRYLL